MLKKSQNAHPEIIAHISLNIALLPSSQPQSLINPGAAGQEKTKYKTYPRKNITII